MKLNLHKLIFILLPFIGFSQSSETLTAEEISQNYLVIAPHGIYEGYSLYYYGGTDWNNIFPKEYSYYINREAFKKYLNKEVPDFYQNLTKYKKASNEGKSIYRKSFSEEINKIYKERERPNLVPFKIVVYKLYERAVSNEPFDYFYETITLNFHSYNELYHFDSEKWKYYLKKYDLINTINEFKNIKDVDEIVKSNDRLNKDIEELRLIKYLSKNIDNDLISLEEYDKQVKEYQKKYPGRFTNENRLNKDRDDHIKKIKDKQLLDKAVKEGKLKDIDFKFVSLFFLKELRDEDIFENNYSKRPYERNNDKWYFKTPSTIDVYIPDDDGYKSGEKLVKVGSLNIEVSKDIIKDISDNKSENLDEKELKYLVIGVDNLRVRTSPDLDGETIENLPLDSRVELLNEKSSSQTTVQIQGKEITDFWYKIKTTKGNEGWIHGCCFTYE